MSDTKHTPGPWKVGYRLKNRTMVYSSGALGGGGAVGRVKADWEIATVHNGDPKCGDGQREANARLLAAAPALLEACEALLDVATSRPPSMSGNPPRSTPEHHRWVEASNVAVMRSRAAIATAKETP